MAWATSPWWGVFTGHLPDAVAWVLPSAQSTWPAGTALAVVFAAVLAGSRMRRAGAVSAVVGAVVLCLATVLVPGLLGRSASTSPVAKAPGVVRVLSVNTWYNQASDADLAHTAQAMDADVVILAETSAEEAASVAAATGLSVVQPVSTRTRGGGTALLVPSSRVVDGSVEDLHLTRHQNPVAQLRPRGEDHHSATGTAVPLTLMGVHTNAPAHSDLVGGWVTEMRGLRHWAGTVTGPVIMAGDFNATTAHPELRRLVGGDPTGLQDCGGGLFAAPTWPRDGVPVVPVPVLRLDHILVRGLSCVDSGVVGVPGSDHAGVWADLRN